MQNGINIFSFSVYFPVKPEFTRWFNSIIAFITVNGHVCDLIIAQVGQPGAGAGYQHGTIVKPVRQISAAAADEPEIAGFAGPLSK